MSEPNDFLADRTSSSDRILSVCAAAEERPEHPALIWQDGRCWTWSGIAAEVAGVDPENPAGPALIEATSTPDTVFRILAAIDRSIPISLVDPRISGPELRARLDLLDRDRVEAAGRVVDVSLPENRRPLAVLFTSGSTGVPRAVELSRTAFAESAGASEDRLGWKEDDRWLCVLPLAHVGGLSILTRCLAARRPIVLAERFDAELVRTLIERERVTIASFVPTMVSRLLALKPEWQAPKALRAVLLGGGAAPDDLWTRALARGIPLLETWGMTETCSQVATAIPGREPRAPVPLRGWNVRSRNGHLEVKGPGLLTRYLEPGSGSSPFLADGWFSTGDLGTINPDGSVSIAGRADEMILTGGENVSPFEVERALESVQGVRRATVVGIPDPEWGEIVAAALELDDDRSTVEGAEPESVDSTVVMQDIEQIVKERLPTFMRPRTIVRVQRLPETTTGKIDRTEVRRRILDERLTPGHPRP